MMKWLELPFNRVAEVVTGNTPPRTEKESYSSAGIPWVKPPDLDSDEPITRTAEYLSDTGKLKARILPKGSVMVCCIGTIGKVGIAGCEVATNQQINSLIFNKMVDPKYGYYYCKANNFLFQSVAPKAVVPILKKSIFEKIKITLPPPSEQRRIVEILDQADEIRKLRKQADEKAEKIIPALFYKMFGDPIELMKGDNSLALSEFNIEFQNGFACGEKDIVDGTPHLRMNNIDDLGILNLDLVRTVPNSFDKERYRLNNGDVLFMSTNSDDKIGKSCVFNIEEDRHFLFSNHLIRLRIFDDRISPEYLSTYLHLLWAKRFYPSIAKRWVNQSTISLQNLKNIKVYVPFKEKLNKLTDAIKNLNDNRKFRNNSLSVINSLFNNLLSKAFDGSLTSSWREAHMNELLKEMEEQKKIFGTGKINGRRE